MIKLTLDEVVRAVGGTVASPPPTGNASGVSTDSRTTAEGDVFFALQGPNFDGHDFLAAALERGAAAAVVAARQWARVAAALAEGGTHGAALIRVDDPLAALGRLGRYHRDQLSATIIAVVGSNGKTTTKAMIDHVLRGRMQGRASPKSFNNAIGVPLTLLSAVAGDDFLVVEVGTNAPGEIAALGALVRPDMAVITAIGEEHLEKLGDLNGVAAEEFSILEQLDERGFAAINIDPQAARERAGAARVTVATYGAHADADLRVTNVRFEDAWLHFVINERFQYRLHTAGRHNAVNAAAAIAVARRLGIEHDEIAARLESFVPPPMRAERMTLGPVTLINDAYNANPHSALAAIEILESLETPGRRVLVFGEMRELGARAEEMHRRIAERLRSSRIDCVVLVGAAGEWMYDVLAQDGLFGRAVERCASPEEAAERLGGLLSPGDAVLLKASRAVGLERMVEPLRARLAAPAAG